MPPKTSNWRTVGKMVAAGAVCCIGGPALVIWVTPSEEELFSRYNPDLQKRSLENRMKNQEDFDHFAMKLREYSKSNKPIWEAAADDEKTTRDGKIAEQVRISEEIRARKEEIRKAGISGVPGGSL
ncbi:CBP4-domain-containing protein [Mollisia scopiformis]|uniref:Cytochrome b mRNA-processing protein 4 n=1 Tax=Mollisia scopiformis TaxID=149040 RepID=A0A194XSW4_MOLSC|nr:CBP4-domain-containing protein [Mollisia scopiformis]KUJ23395.1 CBP4-domain-containing protein [Mollisia scopiformis]